MRPMPRPSRPEPRGSTGFTAALCALPLLLLLLLLLAGCAARGPAVDYAASAPGLTPETFRADLAECRDYARDTDLNADSPDFSPGGDLTMGVIGGSPGNAPGISSGPVESPLTSEEPRNAAVFSCLRARGYKLGRPAR